MKAEKSNEEKVRILEIATNHPDIARGKFLTRAIQGEFTPEEINLANVAIIKSLNYLEKKLADEQAEFIFGKYYTMADAVCTVRLFRFRRLNIKLELLKEQYPYTAAYYERLKQRNSFSELQT